LRIVQFKIEDFKRGKEGGWGGGYPKGRDAHGNDDALLGEGCQVVGQTEVAALVGHHHYVPQGREGFDCLDKRPLQINSGPESVLHEWQLLHHYVPQGREGFDCLDKRPLQINSGPEVLLEWQFYPQVGEQHLMSHSSI